MMRRGWKHTYVARANMATAQRARLKRSVEDRFWEKVDVLGPDDCWPWIKGANKDGYGQFNLHGKIQRSHRVAFWLTHGRWPTPCCLHTCDNPPCCNPKHLWEGTNADNQRDKAAKGRSYRPSKVVTQPTSQVLCTAGLISTLAATVWPD